jgi:hypothetical protein
MEISAEQREQIQLLLEEELRNAARSAVRRGFTPAEIGELLDDRQDAEEFLLLDILPEDAENPVDDAGQSHGIGEQLG